jgi:hypothetical protein
MKPHLVKEFCQILGNREHCCSILQKTVLECPRSQIYELGSKPVVPVD